jgi:hypothetical protein
MPVIPPALLSLVKANIASAFRAANPKCNPTSAEFLQFCQAIAFGLAAGSPTIAFTTVDQGGWGGLIVPVPIPAPGVGTGVGIIVDAADMDKRIYTAIYEKVKAKIPNSTHEPYPPSDKNTGKFLQAISKGVADAVKTHFATCWILTSVHPMVSLGTGKVQPGNFMGLVPAAVKSQIMGLAPGMAGEMWPDFAEGIAKGYCESIMQKATATVTITGVAGPPSSGTGTGAAA